MSVDVIIPARNEPSTITDIVRVMIENERINQVFVMIDADDIENTSDMIPIHGKVEVHHSAQRGKGQLISEGLTLVGTDRVMFCDADVIGFQQAHIECLTDYNYGMVIGIPDYPTMEEIANDLRVIRAWPHVSGERVVPTALALNATPLYGYLTETQINRTMDLAGMPIYHERLWGLVSPYRMTHQRRLERDRDFHLGREIGLL